MSNSNTVTITLPDTQSGGSLPLPLPAVTIQIDAQLNSGVISESQVCRGTSMSAGIDLRASIESEIEIWPASIPVTIPSGLRLDMTRVQNLCAMILPRSGLGRKGLGLANTVGLIDTDYQGEILMAVCNRAPVGSGPIRICPGDRIAQMVFIKYEPVELHFVEEFQNTSERGEGGFGSTGVK